MRMWKRIARLFILKNRWEAMAVIYALGLGAVERGHVYLQQYPGVPGWILAFACTGAVFLAGARLMETTRRDAGQRRRRSDLGTA